MLKLKVTEAEIKKLTQVQHINELEITTLKNHITAMQKADKVVIETVKWKTKVIEKKVVKVEKEYMPQIQYIHKIVKVKDENETDCIASNRALTDIVY